jgi:hypothetical protein
MNFVAAFIDLLGPSNLPEGEALGRLKFKIIIPVADYLPEK